MTVPEKIKRFLQSVVNLSIGSSQISFFDIETLEEQQIHYNLDSKEQPLFLTDDVLEDSENWDNWDNKWLVIGCDQMGDPIIVYIDSPELPVVTGVHGKGCWEISWIADSLENFEEIISLLRELSTKRTTPEELKENPITTEEFVNILNKIEQENSGSDNWFWIFFLKNEQNNLQ